MTEKYEFVVDAVISLNIGVEANSLQEAINIAQCAPVISLCHQCSRGEEGEWSTSGELDCDPSLSVLSSVSLEDKEVDIEEARKLW